MMSKKEIIESKTSTLLPLLRNITFFIAVYLYFIGWLYLHSYFYSFGIDIYSLEIPFYYIFIYSYHAFGYSIFPAGIFTAVLVIGVPLLIALLRLNELAAKSISVACLIVLVVISYNMSTLSGKRYAEYVKQGKDNKAIRLSFKEDAIQAIPREIIQANNNDHLVLLTQTKDRYIVFYTTTKNTEKVCITFEIAKNDVHLAEIETVGTQHVTPSGKVNNIKL